MKVPAAGLSWANNLEEWQRLVRGQPASKTLRGKTRRARKSLTCAALTGFHRRTTWLSTICESQSTRSLKKYTSQTRSFPTDTGTKAGERQDRGGGHMVAVQVMHACWLARAVSFRWPGCKWKKVAAWRAANVAIHARSTITPVRSARLRQRHISPNIGGRMKRIRPVLVGRRVNSLLPICSISTSQASLRLDKRVYQQVYPHARPWNR